MQRPLGDVESDVGRLQQQLERALAAEGTPPKTGAHPGLLNFNTRADNWTSEAGAVKGVGDRPINSPDDKMANVPDPRVLPAAAHPDASVFDSDDSNDDEELDRRQDVEEFTPEDIQKMLKHARLLGTGSFGKVYESTYLGTPVAVKILKRSDRLPELKAEIDITRARPHPNVIQYLGSCTKVDKSRRNTLVIVMELLDTDLERLLADQNVVLSMFTRMKIAYEAALGLAWLHGAYGQAILHRDFATKNLFVRKTSDGWNVKVADFGLSKRVEGHGFLRNVGDERKRPPGTPLTQAPEVMRNQVFGTPADVYSFGMVLWEILTRRPLFEGWEDWCSYEEFVVRVTGGYRHTIPADAPPRIRRLIECCWLDDPPARPSMSTVVSELQQILVEVAIADAHGQRFWKTRLMGKDHHTFRDNVPWTTFVDNLYSYLNTPRPHDPLEVHDGNAPTAAAAAKSAYMQVSLPPAVSVIPLDGMDSAKSSASVSGSSGDSRSGASTGTRGGAVGGGLDPKSTEPALRKSDDSADDKRGRRKSQILGEDVKLKLSKATATGSDAKLGDELTNISGSSATGTGTSSKRQLWSPAQIELLNYRALQRVLCGDRGANVNLETFGAMLDWFGPLTRMTSCQEPAEVRSFLDRLRLVLSERWFHGPVEAQTAADIVSGGPVGTFLIRYSNQPGAFTIVVKTAEGARHIRIIRRSTGAYTIGDSMDFASLPLAMDRVGPALSPPLLYPASGSRYISLFSPDSVS